MTGEDGRRTRTTRSRHLRVLAQRLAYLCGRIDPGRGLHSAMTQEAASMAWAIEQLISPAATVGGSMDSVLSTVQAWRAVEAKAAHVDAAPTTAP